MMKKSKLWAKFKIREELHRWWGVEGGIDEDGIDDVLKIIEQIEEPEVLSQEWIHENKEMYLINDTSENAVPDYKLQNILVPKRELPVIPEYVADWIEENGERYENRFFTIGYDLYDNAIHRAVGDWVIENEEKFVRAWFDGYEAEEEKYYTLDFEDIPLLEKVGGQIQKATSELSIHEKGRDNTRFKLTEQEIKGYDERFWAFAEPVE